MQLSLIPGESVNKTPSKIDIICKLFEIESLINDAIRYKNVEGKYLNMAYLLNIHMERKKLSNLGHINYCRKYLCIYPEYSEEVRLLTIRTNKI